MRITARLSNTASEHRVEVETDGRKQTIAINPKSLRRGSSINGGELLFAALATCFCNDVHREASKRSIVVEDVAVEVMGTFGKPGEPARDITYRVQARADAPQAALDELVRATDAVTEIQNTLRAGCAVRLVLDQRSV
jgi:organic hydroperoxide reductase OsmC/OhrA